MNIFIKGKEHALGINPNLRSKPFHPVDIEKYYKQQGNGENKVEVTAKSYMKASSPKPLILEVN